MNKATVEIKLSLSTLGREKLQLQLLDIKDQLSSLQSSGAEEGKSSAGDKYETQREMIKQSQEILDAQSSRLQLMIKQLTQISCEQHNFVKEGALAHLSIGWVWISVSLGKLVYDGQEYQLISKESPLFMAIKGLKAEDSLLFRGKKLNVYQVL